MSAKHQKAQQPSQESSQIDAMPFDDALRKILSAPPAPKVKPKPKKDKKSGS